MSSKFKLSILTALVFAFVFSCTSNQSALVDYKNPNIKYLGRIDFQKTEGAELYWSGSSIKINFKGTSVKAIFSDERADNYFNVIIDDGTPSIIKLDSAKTEYLLASDLENKMHSVELYKRTEWDRGKCWFYGFVLENGGKILDRPSDATNKIEFFGNSITAGYSVEDYSGRDRSDSVFTNNYATYAAITARHFNADAHFTVKSGIGILVSWFPQIMPEIYNLTDPLNPESKWDFSTFTPQIVVINLFQNDSWLVHRPEHEQFKTRFGKTAPDSLTIIEAYRNFVQGIRLAYPDAKIICMLGNMDITQEGSVWPNYVREAAVALQDPDIYTFFMPYKNTPGHPNLEEQQAMADSLIQFIEEKIGATWN